MFELSGKKHRRLIHSFFFESGHIGLNHFKSPNLTLKLTNRYLSSVPTRVILRSSIGKTFKISKLSLQVGKELEHLRQRRSMENDKIYQYYFTTSFFFVILRVIWDWLRLVACQNDATVPIRKTLCAHPRYCITYSPETVCCSQRHGLLLLQCQFFSLKGPTFFYLSPLVKICFQSGLRSGHFLLKAK